MSTSGTPRSTPVNGGKQPTASTVSTPDPDIDVDMDDEAGRYEKGFKIGKPNMFHGKRDGLDDWLNQLELYFLFSRVPEGKKTLIATTYMRGRAQHWIRPRLKEYFSDGTDTGDVFADFSNFRTEVDRVFGLSNEDSVAERAIQTLRQETSAADYASRFQEYAVVRMSTMASTLGGIVGRRDRVTSVPNDNPCWVIYIESSITHLGPGFDPCPSGAGHCPASWIGAIFLRAAPMPWANAHLLAAAGKHDKQHSTHAVLRLLCRSMFTI